MEGEIPSLGVSHQFKDHLGLVGAIFFQVVDGAHRLRAAKELGFRNLEKLTGFTESEIKRLTELLEPPDFDYLPDEEDVAILPPKERRQGDLVRYALEVKRETLELVEKALRRVEGAINVEDEPLRKGLALWVWAQLSLKSLHET